MDTLLIKCISGECPCPAIRRAPSGRLGASADFPDRMGTLTGRHPGAADDGVPAYCTSFACVTVESGGKEEVNGDV